MSLADGLQLGLYDWQVPEWIQGYCPLCRSRCGCISRVESGRLISVEPDRSHPTGEALCSKGKAAPDLVYHADRLTHPLRRTRPKGSADPGWERITWKEALEEAGLALRQLRERKGPESVAFSLSSPSASAISDSLVWAERLINLFGSPNICTASEYCNWQKDFTTREVFGTGLPVPDYERAGCIVLWGFNPLTSWLSQAMAVRRAQRRGARLVVVDPRRSGLAARADQWLRVRPGSDGILAGGLANVLIREELHDEAFVRRWTHGSWDSLVQSCRAFTPERVEARTGVPRKQLIETARLLGRARPACYYTWSGIEQHANATSNSRAISQLFALLGDFDAPGGNVLFEKIPLNDVSASDQMPEAEKSRALGLARRPTGPPRMGWITADDLYTAILDRTPYSIRGLVALGSNLLLSRPNPRRGRRALEELDFYLHTDLFLNPSAREADIILPVCSAWEREGLRAGFEVGQAAENRIQLRRAVVPPRGESRPDTRILFDLALELGFAEQFWQGDIDRALSHLLAPSRVTLEELRENPQGVDVDLKTRFRKYQTQGFNTPSGLVELIPAEHSVLEELASESAQAEQAFPLLLTCAKLPQYCNAQHRNLPRLRRHQREPQVEIHPETAACRGITDGAWVRVLTAAGSMRARARCSESLSPEVVCAQFGWWQECSELGLPGYPIAGSQNSNFNRVIGSQKRDPVSGALSLRSHPCEVELD